MLSRTAPPQAERPNALVEEDCWPCKCTSRHKTQSALIYSPRAPSLLHLFTLLHPFLCNYVLIVNLRPRYQHPRRLALTEIGFSYNSLLCTTDSEVTSYNLQHALSHLNLRHSTARLQLCPHSASSFLLFLEPSLVDNICVDVG